MTFMKEYGRGDLQNCPTAGLKRPLGLQKFEASRIARQSAHEGIRVVKVVSQMHRPTLPPEDISVRG
jgi:hypothetical protein